MAESQSIDISHYAKEKEAGNASIIKIDGVSHLRIAAQKPTAVLIAINGDSVREGIKQKQAQIVAIQDEIATLEQILQDIDDAKEVSAQA